MEQTAPARDGCAGVDGEIGADEETRCQCLGSAVRERHGREAAAAAIDRLRAETVEVDR